MAYVAFACNNGHVWRMVFDPTASKPANGATVGRLAELVALLASNIVTALGPEPAAAGEAADRRALTIASALHGVLSVRMTMPGRPGDRAAIEREIRFLVGALTTAARE